MENEVKIFNHSEFGEVRTILKDGEPWMVGKDIANALGYSNVRDAILKHVDKEDKGVAFCDTLGGKQQMTIINESGMYALVFGSKLESAKRFKKWVTSEVLPAIRKTGGYVNNDELFINTYLSFADESTKSLFRATLKTINEQNKKIKELNNVNSKQKVVIKQKQEVINGFTDDIDVYTKKDIINRICRRTSKNDYANRYTELYKCFLEVYHIDLVKRMEGYNLKHTKSKDKFKSVIKYAEKFGHIDNLYKCCTKLYETEVKTILRQLGKLY